MKASLQVHVYYDDIMFNMMVIMYAIARTGYKQWSLVAIPHSVSLFQECMRKYLSTIFVCHHYVHGI